MVQNIQGLVGSIRSETGIVVISAQITSIASIVGQVISSTEKAIQETGNAELRDQGDPILRRLGGVRQRLLAAGEEGKGVVRREGGGDGGGNGEYRRWAGGLPPLAFEIARETKELVQRVEGIDVGMMGGEEEDFA